MPAVVSPQRYGKTQFVGTYYPWVLPIRSAEESEETQSFPFNAVQPELTGEVLGAGVERRGGVQRVR